MKRISRHLMFMQIAETASRRSTCFRRNVGCVIVKEKRLVSIGYNGPPPFEPHCTGADCADHKLGCLRAVHAEQNAVMRTSASEWPGPFIMYVTESPCDHCALYMLEHMTFEAVYFMHEYRLTEGCHRLIDNEVKLFRMTPAGHIIDWATNELVDAEKP